MLITKIDESQVQETFGGSCIDLVSAALGGQVLACSDEFFAGAANLLNPAAPIRRPGHFVASGAWYDGWETRRHNPQPADWVVVKLGVPAGVVHGVEVDTAHFNGNHAPAVSVEGVLMDGGAPDDAAPWRPLLPRQPCGPSKRHIWKLASPDGPVSHVRLNMFPDGGIARFRLLGSVVPVSPTDHAAIIDLAHVANGGLALACSDQHFGSKDNLLLPGRGQDMGDGWETARSRVPGHVDWAIVKFGAPGYIEEVIVDTLHFRGNFPQAIEVYALHAAATDEPAVAADDGRWTLVVPRSACAKDTEHAFSSTLLLNVADRVATHVKLVIIPDGGVKRLRVFGRRAVADQA